MLEVAGIGYKVSATLETLLLCLPESTASLWIYHVIREDSSDLYGFLNLEDKETFELLISVSGIGPKTALGILNVASVASLRQAVSTNDTTHLIKVGGIGKKNAEKIVLELRGKLVEDEGALSLKDEVDALEALKALGFGHKEARETLQSLPHSLITTESRIKEALKILGK